MDLDIKPENIEFMFENEDKKTWTIGLIRISPDGKKTQRRRDIIPAAQAKQLAQLAEKRKKEKQEFDRRNGVIHGANEGSGVDRRELKVLRPVRERQVPKR